MAALCEGRRKWNEVFYATAQRDSELHQRPDGGFMKAGQRSDWSHDSAPVRRVHGRMDGRVRQILRVALWAAEAA